MFRIWGFGVRPFFSLEFVGSSLLSASSTGNCLHDASATRTKLIWVVVKMRVPFWVLIIVWHGIFRVPKKGLSF